MSDKPLFSVCLIARNEAQSLPRLINSLKEFQDRGGEVILVDTGSTDGTPNVARSLGCKVEEVGERFVTAIDADLANLINCRFIVGAEPPIVKSGDRLFDYSASRNYAASLASNDTVSMPDCDEAFTCFDIDAINKAIAGGAEQLEYEFVFSHGPNGEPLIAFKHCKFYNRTKQSWSCIIHEILHGVANRVYLPPTVIKLEHWQQPQEHRGRYLAGLALDCYQHPNADRQSHYFGRELVWSGRLKTAIKELTRHTTMGGWTQEAAESFCFIGDAYLRLGQDKEALDAYHQAISIDGTRRGPWIRLAEYWRKKDNFQKGACYAAAALEVNQNDFYGNDQTHYRDVPHEILYCAKWYLGDRAGSKEHWRKAYAFNTHNPKYINDTDFYDTWLRHFTWCLKNGVPFIFTKCGDGELDCLLGNEGVNCDGHPYGKELAAALSKAFDYLRGNAFVGEWLEQEKFNSILHRYPNDPDAVRRFYMAIRESNKPKVFVGPERLSGAADLICAERHIAVPLKNAWSANEEVLDSLLANVKPSSIYVFSCGMPAKVWIAALAQQSPDATIIDCGSAFDPIFIGNTRTEQYTVEECRELYRGVING